MKRIIALITRLLVVSQSLHAMDTQLVVANRDSLVHDFLHNHEAFKNQWGTNSGMPGDVSRLLAQRIIEPAQIMLKKRMTKPFRIINQPLESGEDDLHVVIPKFTPDGKGVISQHNSVIDIWDIATGERKHTILARRNNQFCLAPSGMPPLTANDINTVELNPAGTHLMTVTRNGNVNIHNLNNYKTHLCSHPREPRSGNFNADGTLCITAATANAKIWDVATGVCKYTLDYGGPFAESNTQSCPSAKFNASGTRIVTVSPQGVVKVWDGTTFECLYTFLPENHTRYIEATCDNTGEKLLIHSYNNKRAVLINIKNGTCITLEEEDCIGAASFNATGNLCVTRAWSGIPTICDAKTGVQHCALQIPMNMNTKSTIRFNIAQFSQSGDMLWATSSSAIHLWNTTTGECMYTLNINEPYFTELNSTCNMILAKETYKDRNIRIWHFDDFASAIAFLKKNITLEQAMLINCIFHMALAEKLEAKKRNSSAKRKFDFNQYPHLQEYFISLPQPLQNMLSEYVVLKN